MATRRSHARWIRWTSTRATRPRRRVPRRCPGRVRPPAKQPRRGTRATRGRTREKREQPRLAARRAKPVLMDAGPRESWGLAAAAVAVAVAAAVVRQMSLVTRPGHPRENRPALSPPVRVQDFPRASRRQAGP